MADGRAEPGAARGHMADRSRAGDPAPQGEIRLGGMCNDFGNRVPYDDYLRAFSQTRVPLKWPTAAPNLEPREDIWPTDPAPVIRRREDGVELVQLRWGFPPARPKGAPIINFRSE